ncbi:MAG: bifunctional DNA primase/polymerase, partial [Gemmatimonadota bacterium]
MRVLAAARRYHADGLAVTPVKRKKALLPGWQKRRLEPDEFATHFRAGINVGVLNGAMSGGLIDIDLDAPEALAVADAFLPDTALCFGRPSAPRSHRYYRCTPPPETTQIKNPHGKMLIELRSDGSQTVWPPSTHAPSGERIAFETRGEPAVVDAFALVACVEQTAACALLAQRWPKEAGSRHAVANAVAGYLLQSGVPEDITRKLVRLAAWAAGDEQYRDRPRDVVATAKALASGKAVTGGAALATLVGHEVVARLGAWLHLSAPNAGTNSATAIPIITRLSDVEPEQVRWLDRGRLPLGKVTVIDGDPGLGKSSATLDYAARVSTGAA